MTDTAAPKLEPLRLLNARQRMRVALAASVDLRTVSRCYASKPVRDSIAERVLDAARKLGLPEPAIVLARSARSG